MFFYVIDNYVGKKLMPFRQMIREVFEGQDWWAQQLVQSALDNEKAWKPVKIRKKTVPR